MTWIKREVVILPAKKSRMALYDGVLGKKRKYAEDYSVIIPQHLYIISDEEIKEGDWCVNPNTTIVQYRQRFRDKEILKQIIATTDEGLGLPTISIEFIEQYIKDYNNGNQITEVLVEYTEHYDASLGDDAFNFPLFKLTVNPKDNTTTIKKQKESWSRFEVICLLDKLVYDLHQDGTILDHTIVDYFLKVKKEWIDKNL